MTQPAGVATTSQVILVDAEDREIGTMDKLDAHRRGLLHRAVSAFLVDSDGRHLLQRRAYGKYHSAGLWSNTCCSHPSPGESAAEAVSRRLREEMGVTVSLTPLFRYTYRAELENGLIEHEVDHVFLGRFDGVPSPDPAEVSEWRWIACDALEAEMALAPGNFTAWFRLLLPEVKARRREPLSRER
jgi:isopentenyl-diphosphate delta-isomerase